MPYRNPYNQNISSQLRNIDQNHVNRINAISETNAYDVVTPMEHTTLHNPNVTGGSGFAAATVQDLGYEPTMGATKKGGGRRSKSARSLEAMGTVEGGVATSGGQPPPVPTVAEVVKTAKERAKKIKAPPRQTDNLAGGALLTLQDLDKMHGQPPDGRRKYQVSTGRGGRSEGYSASTSGGIRDRWRCSHQGRQPPKPSNQRDHGQASTVAARRIQIHQRARALQEIIV